jgi:hypothetical protein
MGLRLASGETTRIDLGDGAWVEVAKDIKKSEFNTIAIRMDELQGNDDLSFAQAIGLTELLFTVLVRGWSLDTAPSIEAYNDLDSDDANELDSKVMEHFNSLTVKDDEAKKQKTSQRTSRQG